MSKRKISARDFLIEQCLQDAQNEYTMNQLDEGWWDNLKAGARGAAEWLKQDAADSFKLRKKGEVQRNRANARTNGKIKSYANSLAQTMFDFKKNGGSLGTNIKNVDDVIDRLLKISKGKAIPQGNNSQNQQTVRRQQQTPQTQGYNQVQTSPSTDTQGAASAQTNNNQQPTQNATITRKKSVPSTPGNATITNKGRGVTPLPARKTAPQNINQSPNTSGQQAMLNSIDNPSTNNSSQPSETVEEQPTLQKRSVEDRLRGYREARKKAQKEAKVKAKRDKARKKRQAKIDKKKAAETKQNSADKIENPQTSQTPQPQQTESGNKQPKPAETIQQEPAAVPSSPAASAAPASSSKGKAIQPESPQTDDDVINVETVPVRNSNARDKSSLTKGKGTHVGDISNITQQEPLTTSFGDTIKGGYDSSSLIEPKNKLGHKQSQLPGPEQLQLMNNSGDESDSTKQLQLMNRDDESETRYPLAPSKAQRQMLDTIR